MDNNLDNIMRPSLNLLLTEGGRAMSEYGWYLSLQRYLVQKKKGDGHPVLVMPGFLASDKSTAVLRNFLKEIGYQPLTWDLGTNLGEDEKVQKVGEKLGRVYEETGRKVSIIGWSLGGVYAREIAKEIPQLIRQVITLGSPFANITAPNNTAWIYNMIAKDRGVADLDPEMLTELPKPPPVPTTAIYTKEDGIVSWKVCLEREPSETRQNIQVRGSHVGLGFNPAVLSLIADRLQYSKENWVKFKPKNKYESTFLYPNY